jgi:16S rRNA (guanine966-N2)-methyltransferase
MTRIISGSAGGRQLSTPPGARTRPTSDRVREAVFSRLDHLDVLAGARVLDLFAGSGALGLEAASRGASSVVLVESDRTAAAVIRANARAVGFGERVLVLADLAERALLSGAAEDERFDVVFLDPPYELPEDRLADVLTLLVVHRWLAADALVVVERSARSPEPRWPAGLESSEQRRYGETTVWFAQVPEPQEVA